MNLFVISLLKDKQQRLTELNALLNIDEKTNDALGMEESEEQTEIPKNKTDLEPMKEAVKNNSKISIKDKLIHLNLIC